MLSHHHSRFHLSTRAKKGRKREREQVLSSHRINEILLFFPPLVWFSTSIRMKCCPQLCVYDPSAKNLCTNFGKHNNCLRLHKPKSPIQHRSTYRISGSEIFPLFLRSHLFEFYLLCSFYFIRRISNVSIFRAVWGAWIAGRENQMLNFLRKMSNEIKKKWTKVQKNAHY